MSDKLREDKLISAEVRLALAAVGLTGSDASFMFDEFASVAKSFHRKGLKVSREADRIAKAATVPANVQYRGFTITPNTAAMGLPSRALDFIANHPDDGEPVGHGSSVEACALSIDAWFDEQDYGDCC